MPEINVEAFRARLLALRTELQGLTAASAESAQVVELDQAKVGSLVANGCDAGAGDGQSLQPAPRTDAEADYRRACSNRK